MGLESVVDCTGNAIYDASQIWLVQVLRPRLNTTNYWYTGELPRLVKQGHTARNMQSSLTCDSAHNCVFDVQHYQAK